MNGPHFGIIPRRVAGLRLPGREHAVLDVIAIHTDKNSGLAWPTAAGYLSPTAAAEFLRTRSAGGGPSFEDWLEEWACSHISGRKSSTSDPGELPAGGA
jgi:hypothetical protein